MSNVSAVIRVAEGYLTFHLIKPTKEHSTNLHLSQQVEGSVTGAVEAVSTPSAQLITTATQAPEHKSEFTLFP